MTRILTPKKPLDLLQGAMTAREQKRPYTIVFVGVNGVGKSTSLSKVAAYFLSKGFKVGIAACDTFRSGAVEQLRTHALALKVPLFERGYLKEAHLVAQVPPPRLPFWLWLCSDGLCSLHVCTVMWLFDRTQSRRRSAMDWKCF